MAQVEVWYDAIGQELRVGDYAAVATISHKSPQLVVIKVLGMKDTNNDGSPARTWNGKPGVNIKGKRLSSRFSLWDSRAVTYKIPENLIKLSNVDEYFEEEDSSAT